MGSDTGSRPFTGCVSLTSRRSTCPPVRPAVETRRSTCHTGGSVQLFLSLRKHQFLAFQNNATKHRGRPWAKGPVQTQHAKPGVFCSAQVAPGYSFDGDNDVMMIL
jgi:hypothetical protein